MMKNLLIGLLVFGFTTQFMISQEIELAEVHLDVNYKYLNAINSEDVAISVKKLQGEVAFYNLKEAAYYNEDFDTYRVSFYIPDGRIVAAYNEQGEILRTIERFNNIKLPKSVLRSISMQYPNWKIVEDVYKVDYFGVTGVAKKKYEVKLENNGKRKIVKIDADGEFL